MEHFGYVLKMKIATYTPEVEAQMRNFYHSLSEKDRRRYAAIEATKLGHGGITYICRVLHCDAGTVTRGLQDLKRSLSEKEKRIRQAGGGRKSVLATMEGLDEAFLAVLKNHTAGSPMDESVKWSNLSRNEIAEKLKQHGVNQRAKLSRVLGKTALKSCHSGLFNNRLFAGESWSVAHGYHRRNQKASFCQRGDGQFDCPLLTPFPSYG